MDQATGEMTLRDYASVVWRRKWYVIVAAALTTLVATGLSLAQTPKYRAHADVLVQMPPTDGSVGSSGVAISPRMVENALQTAGGSALKTQVNQAVGGNVTLSVTATEDSDVFTFTATSSNADQAAQGANTYANTFIESQRNVRLQDLEARKQVVENQLATLEEIGNDYGYSTSYTLQLEELNVAMDLARAGGSTVIDEATPPTAPFEPNTMRTATLALVVGLLLGLGAAFLVDYLDTSIRSEADLIESSGLPNLAVVPQSAHSAEPYIVARDDPFSPGAESYRGLRTAIKFMSLDRPIRTVLVTSPRPGEGKTTTASNLAIVAARSGQKVLLIDCDLRKPQMHLYFGLPNDVGFTSVLIGDSSVRRAAQFPPGVEQLAVVPSGPLPPDPSDLLSGERVQRMIKTVGGDVDLVVIDSPPVLPVADATILAGLVDGVIVVVASNSTDRRQFARALQRLDQVEAPLLGTVLNRDDSPDTTYYSYGYQQDKPLRDASAVASRAPINGNGKSNGHDHGEGDATVTVESVGTATSESLRWSTE